MRKQNDIGDIRSVRTTSMAINGSPGAGTIDPMKKGSDNPGGTKPPQDGNMEAPLAVPMPKKSMID